MQNIYQFFCSILSHYFSVIVRVIDGILASFWLLPFYAAYNDFMNGKFIWVFFDIFTVIVGIVRGFIYLSYFF